MYNNNNNNNAGNNNNDNRTLRTFSQEHPKVEEVQPYKFYTRINSFTNELGNKVSVKELSIHFRGHLIEADSNAPWFHVLRNLNTKAVSALHSLANELGQKQALEADVEYIPIDAPDLSIFKSNEPLYLSPRQWFYDSNFPKLDIRHTEEGKTRKPRTEITFTSAEETSQGCTLGDVPDNLLALIDLGK